MSIVDIDVRIPSGEILNTDYHLTGFAAHFIDVILVFVFLDDAIDAPL